MDAGGLLIAQLSCLCKPDVVAAPRATISCAHARRLPRAQLACCALRLSDAQRYCIADAHAERVSIPVAVAVAAAASSRVGRAAGRIRRTRGVLDRRRRGGGHRLGGGPRRLRGRRAGAKRRRLADVTRRAAHAATGQRATRRRHVGGVHDGRHRAGVRRRRRRRTISSGLLRSTEQLRLYWRE